jgi:hypothetical protein
MRNVRNAAIVIVLCVVSGYQISRPAAPHLNLLPADGLHDAVAGHRADDAGLHLSNNADEGLHDSVAGNAIPGTHPGPRGTGDDAPPPPPSPRGTDGGIGTFSGPNPNSQTTPPTNPLSPSGPASPSAPPQ